MRNQSISEIVSGIIRVNYQNFFQVGELVENEILDTGILNVKPACHRHQGIQIIVQILTDSQLMASISDVQATIVLVSKTWLVVTTDRFQTS